MYSKRGTESALDLNYEFHQRQSAVSFRVLAPPDGPSPLPCLSYILLFILSSTSRPGRYRVGYPPPHRPSRGPRPPRAIPFSEGTGDEKFWRRHKNAALHFPFKITPFAPFSVYYYQVVQPCILRSRPPPPGPSSILLLHPVSYLRRYRGGALGMYNTLKPPPPRFLHPRAARTRLVELHS